MKTSAIAMGLIVLAFLALGVILLLVGCAGAANVGQLQQAGIWDQLSPAEQANAIEQDQHDRTARVAAALASPDYVPVLQPTYQFHPYYNPYIPVFR